VIEAPGLNQERCGKLRGKYKVPPPVEELHGSPEALKGHPACSKLAARGYLAKTGLCSIGTGRRTSWYVGVTQGAGNDADGP
jgi:hypothetical protein